MIDDLDLERMATGTPTKFLRGPDERLTYPVSLVLRRYGKQSEVAYFATAFNVYSPARFRLPSNAHQECISMKLFTNFVGGHARTVIEKTLSGFIGAIDQRSQEFDITVVGLANVMFHATFLSI